MKPDIFLFVCAFFAFGGGMHLKNRAFTRRSKDARRKKLRIVLRQRTADRLTKEQLHIIVQAAGHHRQHRLLLYASPLLFCHAIRKSAGHSEAAVRTLFGSLEEPPMVVLIQRFGANGTMSTICIYLPNTKEE